MPFLKYRHPKLHEPNAPQLVDPDAVNENFEDIARLLNGNLGMENMLGGRVVQADSLANGRGLMCLTFNVDTTKGTWANDGVLFNNEFENEMVFVGASVHLASSDFAGELNDGSNRLVTLTDSQSPKRTSYVINQVEYGNLARFSDVQLKVTAGSIRGLTLFFTQEHSA